MPYSRLSPCFLCLLTSHLVHSLLFSSFSFIEFYWPIHVSQLFSPESRVAFRWDSMQFISILKCSLKKVQGLLNIWNVPCAFLSLINKTVKACTMNSAILKWKNSSRLISRLTGSVSWRTEPRMYNLQTDVFPDRMPIYSISSLSLHTDTVDEVTQTGNFTHRRFKMHFFPIKAFLIFKIPTDRRHLFISPSVCESL